MSHLVRSSFIIARRDFVATVFSRAFLFFLIGPLFPVLIGAMFGTIGAHAAADVEQPVVAVLAAPADFAAISAARERLASAMEDSRVVRLARFDPAPDVARQERQLLASKETPVLAVLSGGFAAPQLTGAIQRDGNTARQLQLILAEAQAAPPPPAPALGITHLDRSSGSLASARSVTARGAQAILFILTLLLAGMLLSQLIEEKSNKIIEVLAAAVPIDAIFLGKLFAMLATSMLGIAVWTSVGATAIALLSDSGLGGLPAPAVGWPVFFALAVIYFAMNYLLLGSVFLSIGAQASTVREVQTLSMPVTMGQALILGLATLAVGAPNSAKALAVAAFPLSSPLVMVARAAEEPLLWPHLLAIGWQAAWVALILRIGARLFRRSVLKSGPAQRRWSEGRLAKWLAPSR